jgi:hypothetical protein
MTLYQITVADGDIIRALEYLKSIRIPNAEDTFLTEEELILFKLKFKVVDTVVRAEVINR